MGIEHHRSLKGTDWSYSKFVPILTQRNSRNQQTSRSELSFISATLPKPMTIKDTEHILFLLLPLKFKSL
jgi:hypothetical protein